MAEEMQKQDAAAPQGLDELSEFSGILKETIKPRTDMAAREVDSAVMALVRQALGDQTLIAEDVTIDAMLAKIDETLSAQVNEILHDDEFQKLESSRRGLKLTLDNAETDASLRVSVTNVSKTELQQMMRRYPGAKWDKSPLHDRVYEQNLGTLGGKPFGALIGDYYFDQSSPDVTLLTSLSKIAEASLAPFSSAAAPALLGLDE